MPGRITDTQLEDKNTRIPKEWPWELLGDDLPIIRRTLPSFRCPIRIWTPACPVAAQAGKCPPPCALTHILLSLTPIFQFQACDNVVRWKP